MTELFKKKDLSKQAPPRWCQKYGCKDDGTEKCATCVHNMRRRVSHFKKVERE